jgi:hypothetical protein
MTWIISDDEQRKAINEIEKTRSDRAAGIVGGAFVENDLRNAIETRLVQNDNLLNKMFKPSGPLGPFETKATLGFLLGIYDKDTLDDIVAIAKVRNAFAHSRKPLLFTSREISDQCRAIKIVDREPYPSVPGIGLPDWARSPPRLAENAGSKDRFIQAIKLLTITFWAASHELVIDKEGKPRRWGEPWQGSSPDKA